MTVNGCILVEVRWIFGICGGLVDVRMKVESDIHKFLEVHLRMS